MLRLFIELPIVAGQPLTLPPEAARHVQVLRLQPGQPVVLFNGHGGEWQAEVVAMGRREVEVRPLAHVAVDRERPGQVVLAVGMPANDRFDWLVEKATELGAHEIQPLTCERSVLRVSGERAERKTAHWQGIAVAAAEQCGRTRVPTVHAPVTLPAFLAGLPGASTSQRLLLSLHASAVAWDTAAAASTDLLLLSGPEGGLSAAEESAALARGFQAVSLGRRVLRAETAPLACLARLPD
jgi:16S rRNA (uracil1498-N3)-methyltransferase